ncbi:large conductance mechanosensitive channel protein MscL [Leucobacter luti]|uniref:Large-conductance mechanosensitive channel n=1 Tax=Leucobacter luti TaxID=340320 RepID=A0A4V6MDQ4_9MICO|nr:large conductance mechanosensitive channel protein MscL [Leucobacter luti]MBL3700903.1 large conductance mechanosensitive channel protein MscL [Leucobacter luti]RZT68879.1 large conductance mechanosensitive channel [Leucobacter luti]
MFKGFKEFLLRGNVVDLAVAVVIGAAFNAVVQKVVDSLINPIIGMVFKADSLDDALVVGLPGGGAIAFGALIGAVLNFLIVAAVVYFVFVLPMNKLRDATLKVAGEPESEPTAETEQELLAEIRDLLRAQAAPPEAAAAAPAATPAADPGTDTPGAHRH